jgi:hypothetical protein
LLKAVWELGPSESMAPVYRMTAWAPEEQVFLEAVDVFGQAERSVLLRPGSDAAAAVAAGQEQSFAYFSGKCETPMTGAASDRFADWYVWQFHELPGWQGPTAFLLRLLTPVIVLIAGVSLLWNARGALAWVGWVLAVIGGWVTLWVVGNKVRMLCFFYFVMNSTLRKIYDTDIVVRRVNLADVPQGEDPAAFKYTQDLLDLGATHCFDMDTDMSAVDMEATTRVFWLSSEHTYVHLSLMRRATKFRDFPSDALLLIKTYCEADHTVSTVNAGAGYRKNRDPKGAGGAHLDVRDPATLLDRHRAHLRRAVQERGFKPRPVQPDEIPALTLAEHQWTRERYARRRPYTWGDALHEVFGVVRPNPK